MECQRRLVTRKVSLCPTVKCIDSDKMEERFLYHMKDHLDNFSKKKNILCGVTPST